jgi:hypothetical protein
VNYCRVYWLCLLGVGGLWILRSVLEVVSGSVGLHVYVPLLLGASLSIVAGRALRDLDEAGGPDGPTPMFFVAVLAFLIMVVVTAPVVLDVLVTEPATA